MSCDARQWKCAMQCTHLKGSRRTGRRRAGRQAKLGRVHATTASQHTTNHPQAQIPSRKTHLAEEPSVQDDIPPHHASALHRNLLPRCQAQPRLQAGRQAGRQACGKCSSRCGRLAGQSAHGRTTVQQQQSASRMPPAVDGLMHSLPRACLQRLRRGLTQHRPTRWS